MVVGNTPDLGEWDVNKLEYKYVIVKAQAGGQGPESQWEANNRQVQVGSSGVMHVKNAFIENRLSDPRITDEPFQVRSRGGRTYVLTLAVADCARVVEVVQAPSQRTLDQTLFRPEQAPSSSSVLEINKNPFLRIVRKVRSFGLPAALLTCQLRLPSITVLAFLSTFLVLKDLHSLLNTHTWPLSSAGIICISTCDDLGLFVLSPSSSLLFSPFLSETVASNNIPA
eukprot:748556-Hanusia_phi.AAC.1